VLIHYMDGTSRKELNDKKAAKFKVLIHYMDGTSQIFKWILCVEE
jgi:hypothetical protein